MKKRREVLSLALFFALCFVLFGVPEVRAQSILDGKITGTVTDDRGEPLPGATVEITSPSLMGKRAAVTSAKGAYIFLSVPIGEYKLTASMPSFKTVVRENVRVAAGASVVIDIPMSQGAIEELVTVVGAAPVVDVKTSTIDSTITQELLAKLPTSRDSFYDLSLSTPGMFDVGKNVMGSPTAYGGSTMENIFLVNGLDTTDPSGAGYGSMINVNYDNVQEVRMISLGSKAEYGNFSGVAIDVVTKSGSDKFRGSLSGYSQLGYDKQGAVPKAEDLGRSWLYLQGGDDYRSYPKKDLEVDLTLGGPILRDSLWFFAALNYLDRQNKELNWEPISWSHGRYADIKLTGTPFTNNHAWVSYHYENNNGGGITDGSLDWDPSMAYDYFGNSHSLSSQWQWFPSTATFFSAKVLGFWVNSKNGLPDGAPDHPGLINWWKGVPFDSGVGGAFPGANRGLTSRVTLQADMSHYAENFLGEHDIKFGVQYTRGRLRNTGGDFFGKELIDPDGNDLGFFGYYPSAYPYRWIYNIQYMQSWYYDYNGLMFYVDKGYSTPHRTVRTSDGLGFFFDDSWTPTKRLTFNLGLRYDHMSARFGEGGLIFEQPTSVAAWDQDLTVIRSRTSSPNLFDFHNWSPRLGVSYALTKDQKTVLRASFGRYYTPIGVESFGGGGPDLDRSYSTTEFYQVPWDNLDLNGDGYITGSEFANAARQIPNLEPINAVLENGDWTTVFRSRDPSWGLKIDPNLKNQHTDQWTVNLERELFRNFSVGVTYINRVTKDVIVQWPLNQETQQPWEYEVKTQTVNGQEVSLYSIVLNDYDGNGVIDAEDIVWLKDHQDFEWRNMPDFPLQAGGPILDAQRKFQGLQITFTKRYSDRWQLLGSLLFNKSTGFAGRNKRQDQDYNMEGTNIWSDQWLGGLNQTVNNMTGPMPFTPRFEFKINGNYTIPKLEMDIGLRFRLHTGRPVWVLGTIQQIDQWNYDPENADLMEHGVICTTGGYEGQIVAQDPTKPLYMPVLSILDLRLEKSFRMGGGRVRVMLDAFNLFNSSAVTNAMVKKISVPDTDIVLRDVGRVVGLVSPRRFRLGVMYQF